MQYRQKEFKHFTTESQQNTKDNSNAKNKGQKLDRKKNSKMTEITPYL